MSFFNVVEILDGNRFRVDPGWKYGEISGNIVVIAGYNPVGSTEDIGVIKYLAKQRLINLINLKQVQLAKVTGVNESEKSITCHVYLNGIDISTYLPFFSKATGSI